MYLNFRSKLLFDIGILSSIFRTILAQFEVHDGNFEQY